MQHFVSIQDLSKIELENLLQDAHAFANAGPLKTHENLFVAALFFEPSTRTRVSFEVAARRLGAQFIQVDMSTSSKSKGETDWDTLATLQAMGIQQFIIRTSEPGLPARMAQCVDDGVSIINAGEAHLSHPSQALLDMYTLQQHKGDISALSIAIVGDIAHSRVAHSFYQAAHLLGCKDVRIVAPPQWQGSAQQFPGATLSDNLSDGIQDVDAIVTLRIQTERMQEGLDMSLDHYRADYSITRARLKEARPDAVVMHPGPINRNVEISDAVADSPQSLILEQVAAGVATRMAIIDTLAGK